MLGSLHIEGPAPVAIIIKTNAGDETTNICQQIMHAKKAQSDEESCVANES